ncbi:hypothetical protein [Phytohabitans kaempferiae]|uniref:PH domain-containing protein n=1 Tax=Phytohabitans kaempferiae TaxID=1620943 RepID=A0ABV6MEX5_9ACTN
MDVEAARTEVWSWLRALAAPLAASPAAMGEPVSAAAPGGWPSASPLGPSEPSTVERLAPASTPAFIVAPPPGPAPDSPVARAGSPASATAPVPGAPTAPLYPHAPKTMPPATSAMPPAATATPVTANAARVEAKAGPSTPATRVPRTIPRVAGAPDTPSGAPPPGRAAGPLAEPTWPEERRDPVPFAAAAIDSALTPLLPAAAPVHAALGDPARIASTVDAVPDGAGDHDRAGDLADLLAGVLEEDALLLGVLDLEP